MILKQQAKVCMLNVNLTIHPNKSCHCDAKSIVSHAFGAHALKHYIFRKQWTH